MPTRLMDTLILESELMFLTVQLNVTLMFDLKKNTIKEVSDNDRIAMQYASIDADLTNWYMNITAPNPEYGYYYILMNRKVVADNIINMNLDSMPGFRLIWNYDSNVKAEDKYSNEVKSKYFAR